VGARHQDDGEPRDTPLGSSEHVPPGPPYHRTHRRLLAAATALAGAPRRGPLTAERLAAAAGTTVEELFAAFPDADSAVLAAHDLWVDAALRPPGDGTVAALVHRLYGCLADRPDVARLCLVAAPGLPRRGTLARDRAVDRLRQAVAARAPDAPAPATRLAAGGIYDTAQHLVAAGDADGLRTAAGPVARTWTVVLAGARDPPTP
jgi:hypothetical protein